MRKYIYIIVAASVLLPATLTSCKKSFLEIVPKGKLIATTYDDYNKLMNGSSFYYFASPFGGGLYEPAQEMGDEIGAEETYFNNNSVSATALSLFQWEDDVFFPVDDTKGSLLFTITMVGNLYTCNTIIRDLPDATTGTAQQKKELQAEAKAQRAFTYFNLINYYGKPYNASTAATDPGFPIITRASIADDKYTRASVQEVYDFIIKDFTEAIPDLQVQTPVATRMSKAAAEGLLGKVYLFMGNYTQALTMFNAAFTDLAKMPNQPRLYDYNVTLASDGSFMPIDPTVGPVNSPFNNTTDLTESVFGLFSYCGNYNGNGFGNDFLVLTPQTVSLYDSSDLRLKFYSNTLEDGSPNPGGRLRKYGVQYARAGLELPDLYLLRAECKARLNDLGGAKTDVETLRKNRMPSANASVPSLVAGNQTALIKFIIEERIREFAGTGYRWFDMRRLSTDPIFSGQPAAVHTEFLTDGGSNQFTLRPQRLTLRIPPYYLNANPGMTDNP